MRLHFIVEGQTEEAFINRVLVPYLTSHEVWGNVRCVMTSKKRKVVYRGGVISYTMVKNDITLWMKEDQNSDVAFTTMFDLYALPSDFPCYDEARKINDVYKRVEMLEQAISKDIQHPRFIPYIQLHEFEALIFADPQKLDWEFFSHDRAIKSLINMTASVHSPELIDDGNSTAPSKRIIQEIPEYEGMKVSAGPLVVEKIGLRTLRQKCPHFAQWLEKLESFNQDVYREKSKINSID